MERLLTGRIGGPWETLAKFVARRLETRYLPIEFSEEAGTKKARIAGLLETAISQIRGRDRTKPVLFENIFNQIHAPTQVLATGSTTYDDGVIRIDTTKTHALHSQFEWRVE